MPELPEVETVKRTLERYLLGKEIASIQVRYEKIIANETKENFEKKLKNETIQGMNRRGKWLIFELDHYDLVSHLRMEGKYFLKSLEDEYNKHEHVIFHFTDGSDLRYQDTRKFGRMYLFLKGECFSHEPLRAVGLEPWSDRLDANYLRNMYSSRNIPIKTVLLDQSIVAGIGNIYADEILFASKIHPLTLASQLSKPECTRLIEQTQRILKEAIQMGGTTIKSYESEQGVHGRFQQNLQVHNQSVCPICHFPITRLVVGGRSTYFCKNCQKKKYAFKKKK